MKLPGNIFKNSYRDRRTGELHKAKNYTAQYWRNGRPVRFTTKTDDWDEAVKILYEKVADTLKRKEISNARPETVIMDTLFDLVIEVNKESGLQTAKEIEQRIKRHLRPFFGSMRAQDVTAQDVRNYKDDRLSQIRRLKRANTKGATVKSTAKATINKELAYLKRAFKLGMQEDPPLALRVPKIGLYNTEDAIRIGVLSQRQYERMRDLLPPHARIALVISYFTGMRKGEICKLRKEWIEFGDAGHHGQILVPGWFEGERITKNGKPHEVRILRGEMENELKRAIAATSSKCPYLVQEHGAPVTSWRRSWRNAAKMAGIPMALFHDLRRTACTTMIHAGMQRKEAMAQSGHKTEHTFERYHIVSPETMEPAISKLETFHEKRYEDAHQVTEIQPSRFSPADGSKAQAHAKKGRGTGLNQSSNQSSKAPSRKVKSA